MVDHSPTILESDKKPTTDHHLMPSQPADSLVIINGTLYSKRIGTKLSLRTGEAEFLATGAA